MRKVLVYGGKKNTEAMADFLEEEMLIEVKRLVVEEDFSELSSAGIMEKTEEDLSKEIGREELIVLADPLDALVTGKELRNRYPEQKFVWYGQGIERIIKRLKTIYVLTCQRIRRLEIYQRTKAACQEIKIVESDSAGWKEMTERDVVGKEEIMEKVKSAQGAPILVLSPDLSFRRMKELVDWRGEVIDIEKELLITVKAALGLKNWY